MASAGQAARAADGSAAPSPAAPALTKTKLFTQTEEGTWTEIGVGVAMITYDVEGVAGAQPAPDSVLSSAAAGEGANRRPIVVNSQDELDNAVRACVTQTVQPRLVIESIEEDEVHRETLLSTPVSADDIYQVQKGTILIWTDPELAREMAASFHSAPGCRRITSQIEAYRGVVAREGQLRGPSLTNVDSQTYESPWAVVRKNLNALRMAAQNNKQRLAMMIRDTQVFGRKLTQLFAQCRADKDEEGQQLAAEVIFALLNPPFTHDNLILGQLVDDGTIDDTIDAVQFYLGLKDEASGFKSAASRRAQFRNPAKLRDDLVARAHFIASVQYLKDLLPLQLDESDAASFGVLSVYLLRLRFELLQEVVAPTSTVYTRLADAIGPEDAKVSDLFLAELEEVVPMLHDLTSSIRNSAIPFDPKDGLLCMAADNGVLSFAAAVFAKLVCFDDPGTPPMAPADMQGGPAAAAMSAVGKPFLASDRPFVDDEAEGAPPERVAWRQTTTNVILGRLADCVAHMLAFAPKTRLEVLKLRGAPCFLSRVLAAMTVIDDTVALQSVYDLIHFASFKPQATPMELADRVVALVCTTVDFWWTGCHRRQEREEGSTMAFRRVREKVEPAPVGYVALLLADVVETLADDADPARRGVIQHRAQYALKALVINLQQLAPGGNYIGEFISFDGAVRDLAASLSDGFLTSLCKIATAPAGDVNATLRVTSIQLLTAFINPALPEALGRVADNRTAVADVVAKSCSLHRKRRQGLLFGAVATLNRALVHSADGLDDPRLFPAATSAQSIIADVVANHSGALEAHNPQLLQAFQSIVQRAVPPPAPSSIEEDAQSNVSAVVAATGSRSAARAGDADASPDTAEDNPYLPRRTPSSSQPRGGSADPSIDDEFQALMAEFDRAAPPPATGGGPVPAAPPPMIEQEASDAPPPIEGLFEDPASLGFRDAVQSSSSNASSAAAPAGDVSSSGSSTALLSPLSDRAAGSDALQSAFSTHSAADPAAAAAVEGGNEAPAPSENQPAAPIEEVGVSATTETTEPVLKRNRSEMLSP